MKSNQKKIFDLRHILAKICILLAVRRLLIAQRKVRSCWAIMIQLEFLLFNQYFFLQETTVIVFKLTVYTMLQHLASQLGPPIV